MKAVLAVVAGVLLAALAGCSSGPYKSGEQTTMSEREERCQVTGSNLPKRDCRGDVTLLPPSAVDSGKPVIPAGAPR